MFKPDSHLMQEIDQWIEANKEAFVKDLNRLVSVPSISVKGDEKYPFGKDCALVLDEASQLAETYGFHVENHEYRCGSLRVKGTGEARKTIGMYAHLDVVPLGEDWHYPPLECTKKDGFLIGRGVGDNKGPAICSLYALRFLKEKNIDLKNDVLLYLGLSEETGMEDIEYFCKTQKVPDFNLVVDTNFPVCYGEKGLMRSAVSRPVEGNLVSFEAGSVVNVIPAKAEAKLSEVSLEQVQAALEGMEDVSAEAEGDLVKITARGIPRHAAFPEGSRNAVHVLAKALSVSGLVTGTAKEAVQAVEHMTADSYGEGCGIPFEDKESGKLTCVGSVVRLEEGCLTVSFDTRYPVTVEGDRVTEGFRAQAEKLGFSVTIGELSAPAFLPLDNPCIPVLSEICDYVQGKHYEPYTMGGGTYARHLPCAIGFGPGVPDAPNPFESGHGSGHQPDECVPFDMLLKGLKTYIISLMELDGML